MGHTFFLSYFCPWEDCSVFTKFALYTTLLYKEITIFGFGGWNIPYEIPT
jgi:hypothetical protein